QGPVVRAQKFINLFHDRAQHLVELQRRCQRLAEFLEDRDFARLAPEFRTSSAAAAVHGWKLFGVLHDRHFLSSAHAAKITRLSNTAPSGAWVLPALLRQYRHRPKSRATNTWYGRNHFAIQR